MSRTTPRWLSAVLAIALNAALLDVAAASSNEATVAGAGEPAQLQIRIVKFADLDLTQSADVTQLYNRIRTAARQVCEPVDARALQSAQIARHCAEEAISRAIVKVNVPELFAYDRERARRTGSVSEVPQ